CRPRIHSNCRHRRVRLRPRRGGRTRPGEPALRGRCAVYGRRRDLRGVSTGSPAGGPERLINVMPITPAELRRMLHSDAVSLTLCGLLLVAGIMALATAALFRRRAAPLLWIAAFSYLYGFRLLIRTGTFRLYVDAPRAVWDYIAAAITYTVPIPIALFARLV